MNLFTIAMTEIRQNVKLTATLLVVSIMLGVSIALISQVDIKIASLAQPIAWGAELAIIPKGVTLDQVAEHFKTGKAPKLLPMAMFETTVDLTNGNVQMSAVLPGRDSAGSFLMVRGDSKLNLDWTKQAIRKFTPQIQFSTSDWGSNVIAAAFASGSIENLKKLQDLIDRKTVAQAFMIADVQNLAHANQREVERLANVTEGLVLLTLVLSFYLAGSWLLENHRESRRSLEDIGFASSELLIVRVLLLLLLVVFPLALGFLATPVMI